MIVNEVSHPFESVLRELLSAYRLTVMRISDASGESVRQQVGEGFDLCMSDGLPELSDGDVVESPFAELESGEAVLQCEKDGNLPSVELSPEELASLARYCCSYCSFLYLNVLGVCRSSSVNVLTI